MKYLICGSSASISLSFLLCSLPPSSNHSRNTSPLRLGTLWREIKSKSIPTYTMYCTCTDTDVYAHLKIKKKKCITNINNNYVHAVHYCNRKNRKYKIIQNVQCTYMYVKSIKLILNSFMYIMYMYMYVNKVLLEIVITWLSHDYCPTSVSLVHQRSYHLAPLYTPCLAPSVLPSP